MSNSRQKFSPDWVAIRTEYEKKTLSVRAIARFFSIDEKAIRKRAKKECWKNAQCATGPQVRTTQRPDTWPSETLSGGITALAGDVNFADLAISGRGLLANLMKELFKCSVGSSELLAEVLAAERNGKRHPRRRELLVHLASLPTRISAARNLASSIGLLIDAGGGKKAIADAEAKRAGEESDWGDDLNPYCKDRVKRTWR